MNLILDCPYICHKVRHGMKNIELSKEALRVEVVFGFLKQLLMICKKFPNINDYIFCWDGQRSYRRKIYPKYKANRINKDKTDEEKEWDNITLNQFQIIRVFLLPMLGFVNNFIQNGIESDDIIASIVLNNPDKDFLLITSDQDMYQLLNHNLKMYSLHTRKLMDSTKFKDKFGIFPYEWAKAKAIGGCDTDNVKGIKGVSDPAKSEKSQALKYLRGELKKTGKVFQRIESEEGQEIIRKNLPLVRLPFEGTEEIKGTQIFEIKRQSLWAEDFRNTFEKFGFDSMLSWANFREWEVTMSLN